MLVRDVIKAVIPSVEVVVIKANGGQILCGSNDKEIWKYRDCTINGMFPGGDDIFVTVTDEELNF